MPDSLDMIRRCAEFGTPEGPIEYRSPEMPDSPDFLAPEPMGLTAEEMNQTFKEITLEEAYWGGRLP